MSTNNAQRLQANLIELSEISNQIDQLQRKRDALKKEVIDLIKDYQLQKKKFSVNGRYIQFKNRKVNEGLSFKFLKRSLTDYFPRDPATVNDILKFVASQRTQRVEEVLENRRQ